MLAGSPKKKPKVEKISALFFVAAATIHQIGTMVYKIKSQKNAHLSSHENNSGLRFVPDRESMKLELELMAPLPVAETSAA
jgi:hypothetical protein